jgi:hypothetical protein
MKFIRRHRPYYCTMTAKPEQWATTYQEIRFTERYLTYLHIIVIIVVQPKFYQQNFINGYKCSYKRVLSQTVVDFHWYKLIHTVDKYTLEINLRK